MKAIPLVFRSAAICLTVLLVVSMSAQAVAEVLDTTGSSTARVIRYQQGSQVESDVAQQNVPGTVASPPATARARLDRLLTDGDVTAAGQVIAVLDAPILGGLGLPNDVGLDLGVFSDDTFTSWLAEGVVTERRTVRIPRAETSGDLDLLASGTVRSKLKLSGVLFITSLDATADLTGVDAGFSFGVTQFLPNEPEENALTLCNGEVQLAGGANGTIEVTRRTGVFENANIAVIDFSYQLPGLPLARAVVFTGLEFSYEYGTAGGQAFDLELVAGSRVRAIPGGTGAAAVFGLPQDGFGSAFNRVKEDDRGHQLAALISEHVDTTGQAYTNSGSAPFFLSPFSFCGVMGFEAVVATIGGGLLVVGYRTRCRRRRR